MWNILDLVLGLVLLMYCLSTVVSKESVKTDGIVGRVGGEVTFNFTFADIRDEYNKYSSELYGTKIIQDEIQIEDLRKESVIKFKSNTDSTKEYIIFKKENLTDLVDCRTEINITNDAFEVKKIQIRKEDAGIYWIEFKSIPLRKKTLVITVLNIEEFNNVFESKTFIVQPEYPTIDVKLEPDQRVIIINENEDLKVRCSAKCHPGCDVRWEKEFQVLRSSGSIFITENMLGTDLVIVNISSSHEGFYFCLVNNSRVSDRKGFTLSVTEIWERAVNNENMAVVSGIVVAVVVTIVIVIVVVIKCKGYRIPVLGGRYTSMLKTKTVINYTK